MEKGLLFVISGPSGVGKGTICAKLMEARPLEFSVSVTTRAPRPGEVEGKNYYFISRERFDKILAEGGLLEHIEIYNNCYGTPRAEVMERLEQGKNILLDIEFVGALQVKKNFPEAVLIYVLPPSLEDLRSRLEGRGSETAETLENRLGQAVSELDYLKHYDYYVVNDSLEDAVEKVIAIFDAAHCRVTDELVALIDKRKNNRR